MLFFQLFLECFTPLYGNVHKHNKTLFLLIVSQVRFVDEIKEVSVPTSSVGAMPKEFYEPGDRVVPCRLGGILPAPGSSWAHSSIQEFHSFVNAYNIHLYICKMVRI